MRASAAGKSRRPRRGRTAVVTAALFAALTVLGGGAGFVLGAVGSIGAENRPNGPAPRPEGVQGEGGSPLGGTDRD